MKAIPQLNYEETGSGPVVVLLHGYLASSRYWHKVTHKLARKHRVITLDLLGFGKSPKPACSRYDYDAHVASIQATLQTIGISEPFTLVGHSMGSLVALRYSRMHPTQVKKLLLTNMPVHNSDEQARADIYGTNFIYRIGLRPGLHALVWPLFKTVTYLRLLPKRVSDGAVQRRSYMFQNRSYSRLRSMRNVIFAARTEADLYAVGVKTVLLSGLQDRKCYLENITLMRLRDNIRTLNVPGGHHLPLTQPELIVAYI